MNDDRLDTALAALARPEPPPGHVEQILARTSGARDAVGPVATTVGLWSARRPRHWLLAAAAASVLAGVGIAWLAARTGPEDVEDVLRQTGGAHVATNGVVPDLNQPVLPPQAYWGMDAFEEFAALRPDTQEAGSQDRRSAGPQDRRTAGTQVGGVDSDLVSLLPPLPSGLPPIELEDIWPAPVVMPPLAPLDDIVLADLPLAPIVMAPITEEEKP